MGAKTALLIYANQPVPVALAAQPALDRAATLALAQRLFPGDKLVALGDATLGDTFPPEGQLHIGCLGGVHVVCAQEVMLDHPSALPQRYIDAAQGKTLYLHAMHSVVDWFAYAIWQDGKLVRALSLSPDSGMLEDIGPRQAFELPYWEGQHPVAEPGEGEDYPFSFHPLALAEAALDAFAGFQLEGPASPQINPFDLPLAAYRRAKPFWKFW